MNFSDIIGKTIESVDSGDSERIVFYFTDGTACESVHLQDCCESVVVECIEGSVEAIIGQPIIEAEETQDSTIDPPKNAESWTRTRQRIRTEAGEATFVWLGESNGYYGETPYFQITHGTKV